MDRETMFTRKAAENSINDAQGRISNVGGHEQDQSTLNGLRIDFNNLDTANAPDGAYGLIQSVADSLGN